MKKDEKGQGAYVRRVREDTQRYIQDLLSENKKALVIVASLETEKQRLQEEKLRLQEQVLTLREELDRYQGEHIRTQRQLADVESENRRFSEQYVEVEQQNSNLANLYVASYRLHGTLDRREVLQIIQEVIINLVGSEEVAIFEVNSGGSALSLVASFGIDPARYQTIPLGSSLIGHTALTGEAYLAGQEDGHGRASGEPNLTACIPLKVDNKVTGAIAVFRLLQQKAGLEPLDYELFDLLATHAAMALYCTALHVKVGAGSG